jgi:MFS family permease
MAFGLLSIFLPLYIIGAVDGTLVEVGIMNSLAALLAIPFSFFWGYMCDKAKRYKIFVLLSFASISILLYFLASTTNIISLVLIYAVVSVFHVAHEAPKNVLIAESHSRDDWEKSFASYEMLTEIGWLIGLLLGFFLSIQRFSGGTILLICSFLNVAAFLASAIFIVDPPFIFERGLASVERTMNLAQRGIGLALRASAGQIVKEKFKSENLTAFGLGLVLFSLAAGTLFTPLPIFFSTNLALSSSLVFAIFTVNSAGGCFGYFFARNSSRYVGSMGTVKRVALIRSGLTILLTSAVLYVSTLTSFVAAAVLAGMGFVYAIYYISVLSLSMELLPEGKAGLLNVLIGLGGAAGCFLGPLLASSFSFLYVFLASAALFLTSFLAFSIFQRR